MKYSIVFVFSLTTLCKAFDWCFITDKNNATLEIYCSTEELYPPNCSFQIENLLNNNSFDALELLMHECEFDLITSNLKRYINLQTLDISYSGHETFNSFSVRHKHLKKFNASYNTLPAIPDGFFNESAEITEIDFSSNSLKAIGLGNFAGAVKLSKIHLSHNQITKIDENSFTGLEHLEYVDLSNNWIWKINFLLPRNGVLKTLHLENNNIQHLDCRLFSLAVNTTMVHISWKLVTEFDTSCWKNQIHVLFNDKNDTVLLRKDNEIEIHCRENKFENIREFKAGRYTENGLEILQCLSLSLAKLDLSGNSLEKVSLEKIKKFTNLRELSLKNANLVNLDFGVLEQLKDLKRLDISHNSISNFSNLSVFGVIELLIFNIAENYIENISEIVEQLNPSIETIILSGNSLGEIQSSTFEKFNNLRELQLRNMNITSFNVDPFALLKSLVALDLSNNDLSNFNFSIISTTLRNLIIFHAADCRITKGLSDLVSNFGPSLYYLDLSENPITEVNDDTFQSLDLRGLNLANTSLVNFNFETLKNHHNLHSLNISYNHLKKANLTSLSSLLDELNLEGNDLTEIDTITSMRFPQLTSITIEKNQFSCEYLAILMRRFKRDWTSLGVPSDPLIQKHGRDCRSDILKWRQGVLF